MINYYTKCIRIICSSEVSLRIYMLLAPRVRDKNSTYNHVHIVIHTYTKPLNINAPAGKLYISINMVKNLGSLKYQLSHTNIMYYTDEVK